MTLIMLPFCALMVLAMAFGAEQHALYEFGYYFYYATFFVLPVLSFVCYRYAARAFYIARVRAAFALIAIPFIVFLLSLLFFAYCAWQMS